MRIARLSVRGLFGRFNYDIPLSSGTDKVTIIHAPNGYGKTTIFRLLDAVFNWKYPPLYGTPFKHLIVEYTDGRKLKVSVLRRTEQGSHRKGTRRDTDGARILEFELVSSSGEKLTHVLSDIDSGFAESGPSDAHDSFWTYLRGRVESDIKSPMKSRLYLDRRPPDNLLYPCTVSDNGPPLLADRVSTLPREITEAIESTKVVFIESGRLYEKPWPSGRDGGEEAIASVPAVIRHSDEIREIIHACIKKYGEVSQRLDSTFPGRVIEKMSKKDGTNRMSKREIVRRLKENEAKMKLFSDLGMLTSSLKPPPIKEGKISGERRAVLELIIQDTETKLKPLGDLAGKIDLMKSIINRQFDHKTLEINGEDGFLIKTHEGRKLNPTALSSGEQHEIVMNYNLLLKTEPGSLILIDEPEISLHVDWQRRFLGNLLEIAKTIDSDFVLATHSPQIVGDREDLTVYLEG